MTTGLIGRPTFGGLASGLDTNALLAGLLEIERIPLNRIESNRAEQARNWMWNEIRNGLVERLKADPDVAARAADLERAVIDNQLSPTSAADELMDMFAGK